MLNVVVRTLRKYRRYALLLIVLAPFVGSIVWNEWPRGDVRFVGEWTMAANDLEPSGRLVLRRNGSGTIVLKVASGEEENVVWRVEGDSLIFGYPSNRVTDAVNRCWRWIAPGYRPLLPYDNPYPVTVVSKDEIRLWGTWSTVVLRRVQ